MRTKRLLGLASLWVGDRHGVEMQRYATWLCYAVLTDLGAQVAEALAQPLERISVEMVCRRLDHVSRAMDVGETPALVPFLVQHARLFALVKAERQRHKDRQKRELAIWGKP